MKETPKISLLGAALFGATIAKLGLAPSVITDILTYVFDDDAEPHPELLRCINDGVPDVFVYPELGTEYTIAHNIVFDGYGVLKFRGKVFVDDHLIVFVPEV